MPFGLEPLVPPSAEELKKQRVRKEKENNQRELYAKELLELQQESRQAKMGSVVECIGEKSCKKAFALPQIYISEYSDILI